MFRRAPPRPRAGAGALARACASALRRAHRLARTLVRSLASFAGPWRPGPPWRPRPSRGCDTRHRDRQRPRPGGEGEFHQDGQDDPFVPPAVGGVGIGRAHRIAMTALAMDRGAAVLVNGVVADDGDGPVGDPPVEDEPGQGPRQLQGRPAPLGEDAVIAGGVAGGQIGGGAEQVGDGAAAGGEDGGDEQDQEALIVGW